jgi:dTDP-4-dehydrorhamnose 3,5-epimerase
MKVVPTELDGVVVVEPDVFRDHRGFFLEIWNHEKYRELGILPAFVQFNHSLSRKGTVRGLHAQLTHPQAKLVRVLSGSIYDVAVDIRSGSPLFGKWVARELSAENCRQMFIPAGFAHGFAVTSGEAQVEYACSDYYHPEGEIAISCMDPDLGIPWPVEEPILSPRDQAAPRLAELASRLGR